MLFIILLLSLSAQASESLSTISISVDHYYRQDSLTSLRHMINHDQVDRCTNNLQTVNSFSDQITNNVSLMFHETPAMVGGVDSSYGTSENDELYYPTSLLSHPLCRVSSKTLRKTIKNVPSASTIKKINRFVSKSNQLRTLALVGDLNAKNELLNTWTRFFSCLGYTESLGTADSTKSDRLAKKYAPKDYQRPPGVEFYIDPNQPKASKLNVGVYQFSPNSRGNIRSCLKAWNYLHQKEDSSCQLNLKGDQNEMIRILGSSEQSFNIFCGIHKLIETFSIQVNTTKSRSTHPYNLVDGKLLPPAERCVSPHFYSGKAYNHFGTLQNSTGSNTDELLSCMESKK